MKKIILIILTVLSILLLAFSIFLCFAENVKTTSVASYRIEQLLEPLEYRDQLKNPSALSFIDVFFDDEKLDSFIKVFNASEDFGFEMRAGAMMFLCCISALRCVLFPLLILFLIYLCIRKRTILSLKTLFMCSAAGSILVILPYSLSLLLFHQIFEEATFAYSFMNVFVALAIILAVSVASLIVVNLMDIVDDLKIDVSQRFSDDLKETDGKEKTV